MDRDYSRDLRGFEQVWRRVADSRPVPPPPPPRPPMNRPPVPPPPPRPPMGGPQRRPCCRRRHPFR